ncbi:putative ATP synthase subunit f, mitochondrial [Ctenocephalides felis]|uniref:putative ATP synthase subunit f, mitochondrial n=1 Tax=Ctenocephalides felis TaxID=7515 RepID=UPI000E6E1744|nr:putative ATP synthase subunit f, mitochondrial [Ctenocephalides felis]
MGFGDYPAEYNPNVHGPYDPARYYGKADTPLSQVKIGELGAWFGRRNKSPQAMAACVSRAWWRWQHKYIHPRKAGIAGFYQLTVGSMILFYALNYGKISAHKNYKYH